MKPPSPMSIIDKAEDSITKDRSFSSTCSICCSTMINIDHSELRPVLLPCGHSLCQGCWISWEKCDHTKNVFGIECPFCRCPILERAVVNPLGLSLCSGSSLVSVVISPVHRGGKKDIIAVPCTPRTTAQSIIDYLDPLIEREFDHIAFPKQHLRLTVQVRRGNILLASSIFIKGYSLTDIGFRDSHTLRLVRQPIKAPHCLLDARLQLVAFTPPVGKFTIVVKSRTGGPSVRVRVSKTTTLSRVRKCLKRKFNKSNDPKLRRVVKHAKRIPIMGLERGDWDHSVTTLEDLRVDEERNESLSYDFLRC